MISVHEIDLGELHEDRSDIFELQKSINKYFSLAKITSGRARQLLRSGPISIQFPHRIRVDGEVTLRDSKALKAIVVDYADRMYQVVPIPTEPSSIVQGARNIATTVEAMITQIKDRPRAETRVSITQTMPTRISVPSGSSTPVLISSGGSKSLSPSEPTLTPGGGGSTLVPGGSTLITGSGGSTLITGSGGSTLTPGGGGSTLIRGSTLTPGGSTPLPGGTLEPSYPISITPSRTLLDRADATISTPEGPVIVADTGSPIRATSDGTSTKKLLTKMSGFGSFEDRADGIFERQASRSNIINNPRNYLGEPVGEGGGNGILKVAGFFAAIGIGVYLLRR